MDREIITAVAKRYPWASWAVWDDTFPDGDCIEKRPDQLVEFVCDHAEELTPGVVFRA